MAKRHGNLYGALKLAIRSSSNYETWADDVRIKDKDRCQKCWTRKDLQTHHIHKFNNIFNEFLKDNKDKLGDTKAFINAAFEYAPFWDVNNGQMLCRNCHRLEHS